ncbi:rsmF [Symbiodinium sp. CCMP2592]|nr:rsmF [Symbiodinium sp. CCMP2592]
MRPPGPAALAAARAASAATKASQWQNAMLLFSDCFAHGIRLDPVLCNIAIGAGGQGQGGWLLAMDLFACFWQWQLEATLASFNSAMKIYALCHRWREVFHALQDLTLQTMLPDAVSCTAACGGCRSPLRWHRAACLLRDMGRAAILLGEISFNAALYAVGRTWQCSVDFLEEGLQRGVRADSVALAALSAAPGASWTSVLSWLRQLQLKGLQANAVPFRTCVATAAGWPEALHLAGSGSLRDELALTLRQRLSEDGRWLLAISAACRLDASPVTVAVLSSSCVRGGSWSDGLEVVVGARAAGIELDVVVRNTQLSSAACSSQWQAANHDLEACSRRCLKVDVISYNTVITAMERGRRWSEALGSFQDAFRSGLGGPGLAQTSPLLACGDQWRRAGALLEVFNQQLRPSLPSYTAVLAETWHCAEKGAGCNPRTCCARCARGPCPQRSRHQPVMLSWVHSVTRAAGRTPARSCGLWLLLRPSPTLLWRHRLLHHRRARSGVGSHLSSALSQSALWRSHYPVSTQLLLPVQLMPNGFLPSLLCASCWCTAGIRMWSPSRPSRMFAAGHRSGKRPHSLSKSQELFAHCSLGMPTSCDAQRRHLLRSHRGGRCCTCSVPRVPTALLVVQHWVPAARTPSGSLPRSCLWMDRATC